MSLPITWHSGSSRQVQSALDFHPIANGDGDARQRSYLRTSSPPHSDWLDGSRRPQCPLLGSKPTSLYDLLWRVAARLLFTSAEIITCLPDISAETRRADHICPR